MRAAAARLAGVWDRASAGLARLCAQGIAGLAALWAVAAAGAAAWLIAAAPPPATFARLYPAGNPQVGEAAYWGSICAGVQCRLCPFLCFLPEGARGRCRVRMNSGGRLVTLVKDAPVSVHIDPIEKKPVFHLLPGTGIYSLSTMGCNLQCSFCQNWEISQAWPEQAKGGAVIPREVRLLGFDRGMPVVQVRQDTAKVMTPAEVVAAAKATRCRSIAYTYAEPMVFFEYMLETAKLARKAGLKNVAVSAGYIEPEPLAELAPYMDVVKIDLKGFDEGFYRRHVGGELRFVLRTLLELKRHKVLTEVVNLVVPTLNDKDEDIERMSKWIKENLGPDTPLFFSRFTPRYRMQNLPETPVGALERARRIALKAGLRYVYLGNVSGHPAESTSCGRCGKLLIQRYGYAITQNVLGPDGRCPYCRARIPGIWK